jgi:hypothetical protein
VTDAGLTEAPHAIKVNIQNKRAGMALRIGFGGHKAGNVRLDPSRQEPLSRLSLDVRQGVEVTLLKSELSTPMYLHCFSAQGTESIIEIVLQESGRLNSISTELASG